MSSNDLCDEINVALRQVNMHLHGLPRQWLIGGSCGLALQQVKLAAQPRDLDIYADEADVETIATSLQDYAVDQPHYSTTPIYRSTLSHYLINGVPIELVGGFRVECGGSHYRVEVTDLLSQLSTHYTDDGLDLKLMPLAHEMIFNLLRNRADRYEAIAITMKASPDEHIPALRQLISRNHIADQHLEQLSELLGI